MIQFTHPLFLWALTGLAIPIGIHLLSRKEGKVLRMGSIRHVQESSTQQFKGIRLNEVLLLLLRSLLIVLFTLLLSGATFKINNNQRWLVIEKGIQSNPHVKALHDSLSRQGYESHYLSKDFPLLEDSGFVSTAYTDYSALLTTLASKDLLEVIVLSTNRINGFNGLRPQLPANIRWIGIASDPTEFVLHSFQISKDSSEVRKGYSKATEMHFISTHIPSTSPSTPVPIVRIKIIASPNYSYDANMIRASLKAVEQSFPVKLEWLTAKDTSKTDWCIWLSDAPLPSTAATQAILLRTSDDDKLIRQVKASEWNITKRLNQETAVQHHLTLRLAQLLIPALSDWQTARLHDRRMIPDAMLSENNQFAVEKKKAATTMQSGAPYLLLLFLAILFLERIIAYHRNQ